MSVLSFSQRKIPNVVCLFDVDGTLTPARQTVSDEMLDTLRKLREHVAIAFVGGSDLSKIREQLQLPGHEDGMSTACFACGSGADVCSGAAVRLRVCRERPDCVPSGAAAAEPVVHQLAR